MPVLIRGDRLSRAWRLDKALRPDVFPLAISLPWVQDTIQRGMDALARKRALPLFG